MSQETARVKEIHISERGPPKINNFSGRRKTTDLVALDEAENGAEGQSGTRFSPVHRRIGKAGH